MRPITAFGLRGMNNLPGMPAKLLDDEHRITPHLIVNAEVTDGGVVVRRQGFVRKINLPGAHSLWAGSVMLTVAAGVLYRIDGAATIAICALDGPEARLTYAEIDNLIYLANPHWKAVYDLNLEAVRSWGVSLPPAPNVTLVAGDLPPGTYSLCYTRAEHGRISGDGPLTQVTWEGGSQGILLNNSPTGGQCWITHPNGNKLFLAQVIGGVVTGQVPQAIPLSSFTVAPPPGLSDFCHAFGRIWGCAGKKLVYSDPFQYEWFREANFIPFLEDLVIVAPVTDGLFVNSRNSTWFLDGTTPEKMTLRRIGDGAVPGSMVVAQMPGSVVGGGYEISRRLSAMPSPVWMSRNGVVVGTHTGHLVHLTEARLRITPRDQGAALYRVREGRPQIIISMSGAPFTEPDPEIEGINSLGSLF
jgi:hypothetical protein